MSLELAAFLGSFVVVFGSLVALTGFIDSKLKAAGYDIPEILLFGFPSPDNPRIIQNMSGSPLLDNFRENRYAQLTALAVAAFTTLFIIIKFGSGGLFTTLLTKISDAVSYNA